MKRGFVPMLAAALCVAATGCIAVVKGDSAERQARPVAPATAVEGKGTVEPIAALERTGLGDREQVSAEVRYVNDSGRTLGIVTIWCRALDKDGYELDSQSVDLTSGSVGPIGPGFKAKRYVDFNQRPGAVSSVVCEVTSAR